MTLTYEKTNKTLSAAAATAMLMILLTSLCNNFSSSVYLLFREAHIGNILANMVSLLYVVFWLPVPIVLLMRKKNILTAIGFLLPVIYIFVVQPITGNILIPLLQGNSVIWRNLLSNGLVEFVFSIPVAVFFIAVIVSSITKGKLFGEKLGIVMLLLGGLAYLTAVISPFFNYVLPYALRGANLGRALENYFTWMRMDFAVVVESAVYILIALAFWRPDREMLPEEPAPEVTE